MKKRILSTLLHYANRCPPTLCKDQFYTVKRVILSRYAKHIGKQIQHIRKDCWSCTDGTFTGYDNGFEWVEVKPQVCSKCGGSGIYNEFYSLLLKWQFGKYGFHTFISRVNGSLDPEIKNLFSRLPLLELIEGKIKHNRPKYNLHNEALLWLFLFYDFQAFKKKLYCSCYARLGFTPMNILNYICFHYGSWKRLKYNIGYRLKRRVYFIKHRLRLLLPTKQKVYSEDDLPF